MKQSSTAQPRAAARPAASPVIGSAVPQHRPRTTIKSELVILLKPTVIEDATADWDAGRLQQTSRSPLCGMHGS